MHSNHKGLYVSGPDGPSEMRFRDTHTPQGGASLLRGMALGHKKLSTILGDKDLSMRDLTESDLSVQ